jgi:hypothetical protein
LILLSSRYIFIYVVIYVCNVVPVGHSFKVDPRQLLPAIAVCIKWVLFPSYFGCLDVTWLLMVAGFGRILELFFKGWLVMCSSTTGFRAFAKSRHPLGEAFANSELSAKASRRNYAGEGAFAERKREPSRRICVERPTWFSVKTFS